MKCSGFACLRVDSGHGGGDLVQQVEGTGSDEQSAVEEAAVYLRVPQQVVGVHRCVSIAAPTVHADVGREVHLPREIRLEVRAVVEVYIIYIVYIGKPHAVPRDAADVGGVGDRYTCMIQGKERELWFEDGRWFVAAKVATKQTPPSNA